MAPWSCSARPGATSRPACPAAARTCGSLDPALVNRGAGRPGAGRREHASALRELVERHVAETGSAVAERAAGRVAGAVGRVHRRDAARLQAGATRSCGPPRRPAATSTRRSMAELAGGPCLTRTASCATTGGCPARRPVPVRISDWREVYPPADEELVREQATRCMDCGIPFCHDGCPLGNRIPDWNDLVRTGAWDVGDRVAARHQQLPGVHRPAVPGAVRGRLRARHRRRRPGRRSSRSRWRSSTGRSTPGTVTPQPAPERSGRTVAVVGSGPAGLAAAQQLARAGHAVTVYERDDAHRRPAALRHPRLQAGEAAHRPAAGAAAAEGVRFVTGVNVGVDITVDAAARRARRGAARLRRARRPGHARTRRAARCRRTPGDGRTWSAPTGSSPGRSRRRADRRGRQARDHHRRRRHRGRLPRRGPPAGRGRRCTQLDLYPLPPADRDEDRDPWPTWPWILRNYPAHEEGGERVFAVAVQASSATAPGRSGRCGSPR